MSSKKTRLKVAGTEVAAGTKAEDGGLSEADVARITDETARSLLDKDELKTETAIWVRRGRVIRKYVLDLQPRGKFKQPDPWTLLAAHPDIRWSANQLRTFVDALELWEQFGEGAPDLPMTFYAIAASSGLPIEEKKAILAKAMEQHLSTRSVKEELAQAGGDASGGNGAQGRQEQAGTAGSPVAKSPGDWKRIEDYAEKLNSELSAADMSGMVSLEIFDKLIEVAERIMVLAESFNKGQGK